MTVRRLDKNHDWTFGQGLGNYANDSEEIAQNVKTRLLSFENDWFLDLEHGLPWLEAMDKASRLADLEPTVKRTVLETEGVVRIIGYKEELNKERKLTISINYVDRFGVEQTAVYTGGENG